jgi:signal transduction histidine kinase
MMKQALLNVVLNGVQAMPQGGTLTISARQSAETVIAEIADQGEGIPANLHQKVFELYFTTKKEGNGIGLAQTYQILDWHHGSVEFESAEGKGTTFRFRIPLATSKLRAQRREAPLDSNMSDSKMKDSEMTNAEMTNAEMKDPVIKDPVMKPAI